MIEGVRLMFNGVDKDGEVLDVQRVTMAVNRDGDSGIDVEFTLEDGSSWSVDVAALDRALDFAKAEEMRTRPGEDGAGHGR